MYLNILDTFNNLFLEIENSFLRLYSVAFIHSNHLHCNQTIADKEIQEAQTVLKFWNRKLTQVWNTAWI